jgi:hypothetical protein
VTILEVKRFRNELDRAFACVVNASSAKLNDKGWNAQYWYQRAKGHLVKAGVMIEGFSKQKVKVKRK